MCMYSMRFLYILDASLHIYTSCTLPKTKTMPRQDMQRSGSAHVYGPDRGTTEQLTVTPCGHSTCTQHDLRLPRAVSRRC
jgi:hypothetical protein